MRAIGVACAFVAASSRAMPRRAMCLHLRPLMCVCVCVVRVRAASSPFDLGTSIQCGGGIGGIPPPRAWLAVSFPMSGVPAIPRVAACPFASRHDVPWRDVALHRVGPLCQRAQSEWGQVWLSREAGVRAHATCAHTAPGSGARYARARKCRAWCGRHVPAPCCEFAKRLHHLHVGSLHVGSLTSIVRATLRGARGTKERERESDRDVPRST